MLLYVATFWLKIPMQFDHSAAISKSLKCVYFNVSNYWLDSQVVQPEKKKIYLLEMQSFKKNLHENQFLLWMSIISLKLKNYFPLLTYLKLFATFWICLKMSVIFYSTFCRTAHAVKIIYIWNALIVAVIFFTAQDDWIKI